MFLRVQNSQKAQDVKHFFLEVLCAQKMLSFLLAYVLFVFFMLFLPLRRFYACLRLFLFFLLMCSLWLWSFFAKGIKLSQYHHLLYYYIITTILSHHYNIILSPQYSFYQHSIFQSFFNLSTIHNTIFVKISQRVNSII